MKPKTPSTPQLLLRSAETTKSIPNIAPNIRSGAMIGDALNMPAKLSDMPKYAPAIVGSIDNASSQ